MPGNKNLADWQIPECHQDGVTVTKLVTKSVTKTVTGLSPKQGHTKDTITKDKKDNKHVSENSGESSDTSLKNLPVIRPEAATHSPKGDKWGTADDLKAAEWMFSRVKIVTPTAQQPNWPAWANDIRLMRGALEVTHHDICETFKWAIVDDIVMNGKLYTAAEIAKGYKTLERTPMPLGHPKVDGKHVSARDVQAVNEYHVGAWLQDVEHKDGKVSGDMYVDRRYAESTEKGQRLVNRLDEMAERKNVEPIHISTGLLYSGIAANGESKGKKYREIVSDDYLQVE